MNDVNSHETSCWERGLALLQDKFDAQIFGAFIEPLKLREFDESNKELAIFAPTKFHCKHLDAQYREKMEMTLAPLFGQESISIKFEVDSNLRAESKPSSYTPPHVVLVKKSAVNAPEKARLSDESYSNVDDPSLLPNPKYTFDNFVVGANSEFCHAAAMHVSENPGVSYNPLFIYGGVGLGKTHLLHAIGNEVKRKRPSAKVTYMSSEVFTNDLILALRYAKMDEFKNKMRSIDVLLIDDIQFISGKERTQEEFFHTFNTLYNSKKQIVITSDKIATEIIGLEERLRTRFAWGLSADLQAPDFETRVAILNKKVAADKFEIPEDVIGLVAERVFSNVRELEGALTRLHALASLRGRTITRDLAMSALKPLFEPKVVNVSITDIKKAVANHFRLKSPQELASKSRVKHLSFPRHIAMYLCRKHTTASYPQIGKEFGGRDHSSVIHAASVVTTKVETNAETKTLIGEIERRLLGA